MTDPSKADVWTFILDDATSLWSWRRSSSVGERIADSLYPFASLNGCITDAQRVGFVHIPEKLRRMNASELKGAGLGYTSAVHVHERRRRERTT